MGSAPTGFFLCSFPQSSWDLGTVHKGKETAQARQSETGHVWPLGGGRTPVGGHRKAKLHVDYRLCL